MLDAALNYARRGWLVLPVRAGTKTPACQFGVRAATSSPTAIQNLWDAAPDAGVGIAGGGDARLVFLDIDGELGEASLTELEAKLGSLPPTLTVRTPRGGRHLYFTFPGLGELPKNSAGKLGPCIDVRSALGYVVAPPTPGYDWLTDTPPAPLPPAWAATLSEPAAPSPPTPVNGSSKGYVAAALTRAVGAVAGAAPGERNVVLNREAYSLAGLAELSDETITAELLAAAQGAGLGEREARKTIASGLRAGRTAPRVVPEAAEAPTTAAPATRKRFRLTDYGNAERLVAAHGDRLRYCPPRRKWLVWDGRRWAWDETGIVTRLAKSVVRAMYREAAELEDDEERKHLAKHARDSEKVGRIDAMIQLARTESGIPVLPTELDADPWLLNVANGTVDLRTGALHAHERADLITKLCPVKYDPAAEHELWFRFMLDATNGDTELAAYLRRVAGYSLLGIAPEKRFFFVYGPPDTAKSTFLDALGAMLGEYHASAAFDTWCAQSNVGGNRGDLVRLAGARLVTSVEVTQGRRFDEALVKRVTGGDELVAAAKYEADVTFRATWTLMLAANDAPLLRDDDAGAWARCQRIPFSHVVPPGKRDPRVRAVLCNPRLAGPAILAWAVQGCLEYQREGLGSCPAVEASTAAYRSEMDRFGGFLSDCCVLHPGNADVWVTRRDLRLAYEAWLEENGIRKPLSARDMGIRLRDRGVTDRKLRGSRIWDGIRLLRSDEDPKGGSSGAAWGSNFEKSSRVQDMEKLSGSAAPSCPQPAPRTVLRVVDPNDEYERQERLAIQAEGSL